MSSMTQAGKDSIKLGNQAVNTAKRRLVDAHRDEFERYLKEERTTRGLPPEPTGRKMTAQQKLERAEERVRKLRQELANQGQGD